ncbi:metal-dependent hydrolase [Candidatus Micrarchaeota archaeon]|nr:metal-dependent hydrolase [Candidatus Micrarchaeota archaeon]
MKYGNIEVKVFGHASVMIKGSKTIYIDPYVLPDNPEKADIVIFTHKHYDHCADPKKILKNDTVTVGADCKYAQVNVSPGDIKEINGVKLEFVHAYNIDKKFHPKGMGTGVIVNIDNARIYHAGDTDVIPEMKDLKNIDIALLPIGGTYTMNINDAVEAVGHIKPKVVIPIHYNTFDGIEADPNEFKRKVEEKYETKVYIEY